MNLPTLIIILIVAAAVVLALWLPRRHGRKPGCSCSDCSLSSTCRSARR